jgi:hypothetical protein
VTSPDAGDIIPLPSTQSGQEASNIISAARYASVPRQLCCSGGFQHSADHEGYRTVGQERQVCEKAQNDGPGRDKLQSAAGPQDAVGQDSAV